MGLFDSFGVGSGKLTVEVPASVAAGGAIEGKVHFGGGKRAQKITALKVWLSQTKAYDPTRKSVEATDTMVVTPHVIATEVKIAAGESMDFPFKLDVPQAVSSTVPSAIEYAVVTSADIPNEIDPQGRAPIAITGGIDVKVQVE